MWHGNRNWLVWMLAVGLGSCGGGGRDGPFGGNDPPPAAQEPSPAPTIIAGQFKDANVTGLSYVSGPQSGLTGPDGEYTCMSDQPVVFSIGAVQLGSSTCAEAVTPLSLFRGATLDTPEVLNVVRFLLLLDDDGDPANGILISDDVRAQAQAWAPVDFSAQDLGNELAAIIDALYVDQWPVLVDKETARAHLLATLQCVHSGVYWMQLAGRSSPNTFVDGILTIFPGEIAGLSIAGEGNFSDGIRYFSGGANEISFGEVSRIEFVDASGELPFTAVFTSPSHLDGEWGTAGVWRGNRTGQASNSRYRFVEYDSASASAVTFDLLDQDRVAATGIAIDRWEGGYEFSYEGALENEQITMVTDPDVTWIGTVDLEADPPEITMTWTNSSNGATSTITAYGCRLN